MVICASQCVSWKRWLFSDVSGFRYSDCECPDACLVKAYGAELSYASLSSLSVDTLLKENTSDLSFKYHRALEIKQVDQSYTCVVQRHNSNLARRHLFNQSICWINFLKQLSHNGTYATANERKKVFVSPPQKTRYRRHIHIHIWLAVNNNFCYK